MKQLLAIAGLMLVAGCNDTTTAPPAPGPSPPLFQASGTITRIDQDTWSIRVTATINADPEKIWPGEGIYPKGCPTIYWRYSTVDTAEHNEAPCGIDETRTGLPPGQQIELAVWVDQQYYIPKSGYDFTVASLGASGSIAAVIPVQLNAPVAFTTIFVDAKPRLQR